MTNDKVQKKLDLIETLRQLLTQLPESCFGFFVSIEPQTQILTRINYARDLKIFFQYLSSTFDEFTDRETCDFTVDDLKKIKPNHIEMFLEFLNLYSSQNVYSENTVVTVTRTNENQGKKRKLSALRTYFNYLYRHELIDANPADIVSTPRLRDKPIVRLESDEIEQLLDNIDHGSGLTSRQAAYQKNVDVRDIALITLMLGTGIRVSECVGIDLGDIDFENNAFRVTRKGGKVAILYFSEEVKEPLYQYYLQRKKIHPAPGHDNAFFLSLQKKRLTQRSVQNLVKKYTQGVTPLKHITPHKLRSTYGTQLYRETGDIYLVADVLGHKDVNTTKKHYSDMSEDNRRLASKVVTLRKNNHSQKD